MPSKLKLNIVKSRIADDKHIQYISDADLLEDIEKELRLDAAESAKCKKDNYYLDAKEFAAEIVLSKREGQLTNKAVKMFELLIKHIQRRLYYKDKEVQQDCASEAMLIICAKWKNYDITQSPNAFSYFTTTIINGLAKGWNEQSKPGVHIPIDMLFGTTKKD